MTEANNVVDGGNSNENQVRIYFSINTVTNSTILLDNDKQY